MKLLLTFLLTIGTIGFASASSRPWSEQATITNIWGNSSEGGYTVEVRYRVRYANEVLIRPFINLHHHNLLCINFDLDTPRGEPRVLLPGSLPVFRTLLMDISLINIYRSPFQPTSPSDCSYLPSHNRERLLRDWN